MSKLHHVMQKLRKQQQGAAVEEENLSDDDVGEKCLKSLLINKYRSNIHILSANGRQDVVGFTHFGDYLLHTKYNAGRQFTEGKQAEN